VAPAAHRRRCAAIAVLIGASLPGCAALGAPSAGSSAASSSTTSSATSSGSVADKIAQAQRTHEFPSPAPAPQTVSAGAASAVGAVRAFANAYINWDARTVVGRMRSLAGASVGQARAASQLAATQAARDYELRRGGIANSGSVEAVSELPGRAGRFVVVTREATRATATSAYQGLRPAWHVALATVVRLDQRGWVLSGWQPES
jgi:hypothetical protein